MNKARFALVVCMAIAAASAWGQASSVAYVDGSVQLRAGTAWKDLDIGQKLEAASTVRLGAGAVLELVADGGRSLLLSKPGTYDLAALWKAAPEAKGAASKLLKVVEKIATGPGAAPATVAGVRGAAAGSTELMWLEDEEDPEALFESGRQAEAQGRVSEAAVLYAEALRVVNERAVVDKGRAGLAAYSAARAFVQAAQFGRALEALRSADPGSSGEVRAPYAILYAALLSEFGDAEGARALLERGKTEKWFAGEALSQADAILAGLKK